MYAEANSTVFSMLCFRQTTHPKSSAYQSIMSLLPSPHRNISTLAPSSLITTILTELAWQPLNRSPWLQGSYNTRLRLSLLISSQSGPPFASHVSLQKEATRCGIISPITGTTPGHHCAPSFWSVDDQAYRPLVCLHSTASTGN